MRILRYLLIFVPLAVLAECVSGNELLIFAALVIALVPLAGVLGEATEELALHEAPRLAACSTRHWAMPLS